MLARSLSRSLLVVSLLAVALASAVHANPIPVYCVDWGQSWDGISLQQVLDTAYGPGAINASQPLGGEFLYWQDSQIDALLIREVAGFQNTNLLGWYEEGLGQPQIDGVHSGVVFEGPISQGATRTVQLPGGVTRFGFYLNPNGTGNATNAPEPEKFFTAPGYNDIGPNGSGPLTGRCYLDVQCLIYDITALRGGTPTWVLAWEDLDAGGTITPGYSSSGTDNDYQDLVVEVQAIGVIPVVESSWGEVKALYR